jgi:class 3 adenylate cyclase/tetratricopeptide (TPR) repeat protein
VDEAPEVGAELRRITVLFLDLVGSTELATRLEPEQYRDVLLRYQRRAVETIERFGGHIAQYLGDGILAYFGYPRAHEDDPIRAVHAGLELVADPGAGDGRIAVRAGIHTGPVVAGSVGAGQRREQLALGPTPNVAARVQAIAPPNTVAVTGAVARLVDGFFELTPLGPTPIRGLPEPIELFRPVRVTGQRTRFELARTRGLTALVGRRTELGLLEERFAAAASGRGRAVLIAADAGLGKSRLVEELRQRTEGHRWIAAGGSPYHQGTPFHPVIDLVHQLLELTPSDPAEKRVAQLTERVRALDAAADSVGLLGALLGLPPEAGYQTVEDTPQRTKQRALAAIIDLADRVAAASPLVIVVEDLHWVDPSTLELLDGLVGRVTGLPILLLMTARPAFVPSWEHRARLMQITLDPLDPGEITEMIGRVAGRTALPPAVVAALAGRSDGVPLFAEELTRAVLETGDDLAEVAIPSSLADSFRSRLDQLDGTGKTVAAAAVWGPEAPAAALAALTHLEPAVLEGRLSQLVDSDILVRRGIGDQARYSFRHALLQETAYGSLLPTTRRGLHRQIGRLMVEQYPELSAAHPEIAAHHHHEAGDLAEALGLWETAGRRSAGRFANVEALAHFDRALECLPAFADPGERARRELALRTAIAPVLVVTRGYGAAEVRQAFDRALELCQSLGGAPELFWTLWGLAAFYQARGPIARLVTVADQMLKEAEGGDPQLGIEAHFALGAAQLMRGDYRQAEVVLERGIAPCRVDPTLATKPLPHGAVTGVNLLMNLAVVKTARGDLAGGSAAAAEGLAIARGVGNPFVLAAALVYHGWRGVLAAEVPAVEAAADEALARSAEIPFWATWAAALRGWARGRGGEVETGLQAIENAVTGLEQAGVRTVTPMLLSLAADLLLEAGQAEAGLRVTERALTAADLTGARAWDAELGRLRGELTRLGNGARADAAESILRQALELARSQGAELTEQRTEAALRQLAG